MAEWGRSMLTRRLSSAALRTGKSGRTTCWYAAHLGYNLGVQVLLNWSLCLFSVQGVHWESAAVVTDKLTTGLLIMYSCGVTWLSHDMLLYTSSWFSNCRLSLRECKGNLSYLGPVPTYPLFEDTFIAPVGVIFFKVIRGKTLQYRITIPALIIRSKHNGDGTTIIVCCDFSMKV